MHSDGQGGGEHAPYLIYELRDFPDLQLKNLLQAS